MDILTRLSVAHAETGQQESIYSDAFKEIINIRNDRAELLCSGVDITSRLVAATAKANRFDELAALVENAWLGEPLDDEALNRDENGLDRCFSPVLEGYAGRQLFKAMLLINSVKGDD